jgi:hypothetical protein
MKEMIYNNQQPHTTRIFPKRRCSSRISILTRLRPRQPARSEEAGQSGAGAVGEQAVVSAPVPEAAREAGAEATTGDAHVHGRETPAPVIWGVPTRGVEEGAGAVERRARARRPSVSSWGSWAAGACAGTLAATSYPVPAAGPARAALAETAGTELGAVGLAREKPCVLAAREIGRASLAASRRLAAAREMAAVAAAAVEQSH